MVNNNSCVVIITGDANRVQCSQIFSLFFKPQVANRPWSRCFLLWPSQERQKGQMHHNDCDNDTDGQGEEEMMKKEVKRGEQTDEREREDT